MKNKINSLMMKRAIIMLVAIILISFVILFALFKLQILNYNKYQNNETPKKDNKNILISNNSDKHLSVFSPPLNKSHLYNNSPLISSTINESKRILSLSVNPNPQIHPFTLIDSECIKSNKTFFYN